MAQGNLAKTIQSAKLSSGDFAVYVNPNTPTQYADRQKTYFNRVSSDFRRKKLKYASDFVKARAKGLFANDPEGWTECRIRVADVVRPSSAIQREFDDYKMIIMESPRIEYVPQGTLFDCMGTLWLSWNPMNISAEDGEAVIRRCRATWKHYDYYGNILFEPLIVDNPVSAASDPAYRTFVNETKGYFNITAQKNKYTTQLDNNSRIMLGSDVYRVTGYTDFLEEFTGDETSARLVRFTARFEEFNERIDDRVNRIAGGLEFNWTITLDGTPSLYVGNSGALVPTSVRMGEIVASTSDNPITYIWTSSDENVCTVDENGALTGISAGDAIITCALEQNPEIKADMVVSVADGVGTRAVQFNGTLPGKIKCLSSETISASYYENGVETSEEVTFSFTGARRDAYAATVDGNTVTVTCYNGSVEPLTITAVHGEYSATISIELIGI